MLYYVKLKLLNFFSGGLPQQWVKNISDDYGGVLPEFLKYIQFIHIWFTMTFQHFEGLCPHGGDKKISSV